MHLDRYEETLAIIKPSAYPRASEIRGIITSNGFEITKEKDTELSLEQTGDFYIEHYGTPFYRELKEYVGKGKIKVLILRKHRAICSWRKLIGPTDAKLNEKHSNSKRASFGRNTRQNGLHGSETYVDAEREIAFFFPDYPRRPLTEEVTKYLESEINPTLLPALQEMYMTQPKQPLTWLANRLSQTTPNE